MKALLNFIIFFPLTLLLMIITAPIFFYKTLTSPHYRVNKELWYQEWQDNILLRVYLWVFVRAFCGGDKSKVGW